MRDLFEPDWSPTVGSKNSDEQAEEKLQKKDEKIGLVKKSFCSIDYLPQTNTFFTNWDTILIFEQIFKNSK